MAWFWNRKKDILGSLPTSGILYLGEGSDAGVFITQEKAQEIWAVHACMDAIVSDLGQIPLHLYLRTSDGRNRIDWTVEGQALVYGPNDYQTTQEWIEQGTIHMLASGDHYARIGIVNSRWGQCFPIEDPSTVKTAIVQGRKSHTWRGQTYRQEEIFHLHNPSPDGWCGRDFVDNTRHTLGLARALYRSASRWFASGGQPRGFLVLPAGAQDPDIQKAKEAFKANYGGDNEWSPAVYTQGTTWVPISTDPEKSQALGSRQQVAKEISALLRFPLWRLYGEQPPTLEARVGYYADTLGPFMARWRNNINKQLLLPYNPGGNVYCEFTTEAILQADLLTRMQAYGEAIKNKIMNPNECRERENMSTYSGGELFQNPNTSDAATNAASIAAQQG